MRSILCFGDSNTHGTRAMQTLAGNGRFEKHERWPSVMAAELGADWDVIAEGHPGRNAVFDDPIEGDHKNGLRILPALLESHKPLDLVIVMLGTNDLKARFDVPASDIALGLERLARTIRLSELGPDASAPKVLLVAPVPIEEVGFLGDMFAGGAAKSRALPALLQASAERQGAAFLDLAPIAQVDMVDGVHLTADGLAAVGQAMANAVKALFQ